MSTPINYSLSSLEILLAVVNNANGSTETSSTVSFGNPQPMPAGSVRDTSVVVSAVAGGGRTGSVTIYYDRINLNTLFSLQPLYVVATSPQTTWDLIPILNNVFGLGLQTTDILQTNITSNTVTLQADPNSLAYEGSVAATIVPPATSPSISFVTDVGVTNLIGI